MQKRLFPVLLLAGLLFFPAESNRLNAQSKKVERETFEWRYEIQAAVGQGATGTALVRVWTYSKKAQLAEGQAGKNAVHGIMFKGYPDYNDGKTHIVGRDALIADPTVESQNEDYFYEFFKTGGLYQRYVSFIGNGVPDEVIKVGKEYKVGITVVVMVDALRKRLEDDGIITAADEILSGKMPTLMVMPSMAWYQQHGYMKSNDQLGRTTYEPDYEGALYKDPEINVAISKVTEMLVKRGFTVKDLEASIRDMHNQSAEDAILTSKSGAEIAETGLDKLYKTVGADICVEIWWNMNEIDGGSKKTLTFKMDGKDTYTQSAIASKEATSAPQFTSKVQLPVMIESAVLGQMDPFCTMLTDHYKSLMKNGRAIKVRIKAWDDFEDGLEAEFDGEELRYIIEDWIADNAVNGKFNRGRTTGNEVVYDLVRIPMQNAKGRDMDAMTWLKELQKYLSREYDIPAKVLSQGLGDVTLIVGGK